MDPRGQALVTSGRWEAVLLWSAIDYLCACLGAGSAALLAASHGNFGAMIVAGLHPAVDCLALDSPLERPLDLPVRFGAMRGMPASAIYRELADHHLPSEPVAFRIPERPGLRCLLLGSLLSVGPLLGLLWTLRGSVPANPRENAAAFGASVAAGAWVLVDSWCPVAYVPHVLLGHVLPVIACVIVAVVLGSRWLPPRYRRR